MNSSRKMKHYLLQATRGLPTAERTLVMAELRGHLLERIEQYQQEGHSKAEAESMALQRFGSQHGLARSLNFAHWTLPAGWTTLGVTLALLGGTVWNIARAQTSQKTVQAGSLAPASGTLGEARSGLKIRYMLSEGRTLEQQVSAQGKIHYQVHSQKSSKCSSGQQAVLDFRWNEEPRKQEHFQLAECLTGTEKISQAGNRLTLNRNQEELQVRAE